MTYTPEQIPTPQNNATQEHAQLNEYQPVQLLI